MYTRLSVVIPAYNEARTIREILERVKRAPLSVEREIIVVDNNSTDDTAALAKGVEGVQVFTEMRPGKGAALKCGIRHVTGDLVIFQDADLEYDPNDFQAMIDPILRGETQVTNGVRREGRHKASFVSWVYIYLGGFIGNTAITQLTNHLYRHDAAEYEGCYKAFDARVLKSVTVHTDNFDFDNELLCKLLKRGQRIVDVSIRYAPRDYREGKKINWRHGVRILKTIVKYRFVD